VLSIDPNITQSALLKDHYVSYPYTVRFPLRPNTHFYNWLFIWTWISSQIVIIKRYHQNKIITKNKIIIIRNMTVVTKNQIITKNKIIITKNMTVITKNQTFNTNKTRTRTSSPRTRLSSPKIGLLSSRTRLSSPRTRLLSLRTG